MNNRLERLRAALRERELGALLVTSAANRRYLSGFSGSAGALLVTEWEAIILSDFRYRLQVARQAPGWMPREITAEQPLHKLAASVAAELGLSGLAIEAEHASLSFSDKLSEALREQLGTVELKTTEGLVEGLREVKDDDEVATLRRAIAITDAALAAVLPQLRPEHSEKQAAWMIEVALREHGAEAISFPVIVAAGPNSALPHAQPGDDNLGTGCPIVIDMGGRVEGYHADLTRTVVLGEPDEQFRNVYATVLAAQRCNLVVVLDFAQPFDQPFGGFQFNRAELLAQRFG
jgi:Xaa-Pro aminopeptidase